MEPNFTFIQREGLLNYEKIVVDLLNRIQTLEKIHNIEVVSKEKERIEELREIFKSDKKREDRLRKIAIDDAIKFFQTKMPHLVFSKDENNNVIEFLASSGNGRHYHINFYHCHTLPRCENYFIVNLADVQSRCDFVMFSITYTNGDWHYLIFTKAELIIPIQFDPGVRFNLTHPSDSI